MSLYFGCSLMYDGVGPLRALEVRKDLEFDAYKRMNIEEAATDPVLKDRN